MAEQKRCYVTTPIYYVNDKPHIGHAYTTLACDVLARFKRLDGYNVRFLTGTDEHGQKVEKSAAAAGVDPQTFTDQVSQNFRDLAAAMEFSIDDFIRTTEERHKAACQALWRRLVERGEIYLGTYGGWYAVRDEAYYTESELTEGPNGERLAPSGAEVEWVEEPSYFFRLSAWGDRLLEHYKDPGAVLPATRRNEVVSFVEGGLQDLAVSRSSLKWGVPVPGDPDHVMYVWLDALTNYLTAVGYPDENDPLFQTFWPADVHMVGKDILRFHAVFWPAFLMAAGLAPPRRVFAHGWWTNEGRKISKSLGNIIDPLALIETYGLDPVRYFLLREVPFGNDGDFSRAAIVQRMNSELANDLGNLAQRSLSMIAKNCGGQTPEPGAFDADDEALLGAADGMLADVRGHLDVQAFHEALERIWIVVRAANGYVDRQAPWALRKTDPERMRTVLYVLAETVRQLAVLMQPFTPGSAARMLDQLAVGQGARTFAALGPEGRLASGAALPAPVPVFPRFENESSD
ncbi:MAG: methionine--tRNA ligase [Rhodospirillales bacterium]